MSKENITVIYKISGDKSSSDSNALILLVATAKEVVLLDVLACFPPGIGYKYIFWARRNTSVAPDSFLILKSPTSVIPVIGSVIYLYLEVSSAGPYIPLKQASAFTDFSRSHIYNTQSYLSASEQAITNSSTNNQRNNRFRIKHKQKRENTENRENVARNEQSDYSYRGNSTSKQAASISPSQSSPQSSSQYKSQPNQERSYIEKGVSSQSKDSSYRENLDSQNRHRESSRRPTSPRSTSSNNGVPSKDDLDAIAEAATKAAKNLFSFGQGFLKTVVQAGQAAVIGATQGQTEMTVGKTKVTIVKELAHGGVGIVYLAQDYRESERIGQYALKQMLCQTREQVEEAHNELNALKRFAGHENIVTLLDYCTTTTGTNNVNVRTVQLLFPLFTQGSVWDVIEKSNPPNQNPSQNWPFSEARALSICLDMAKALSFMHDMGFAHRDMKPHNILISNSYGSSGGSSKERGRESGNGWGKGVLTDFGSVCKARTEILSRQQALTAEDEAACKTSAAYRAPELTLVPQPPVTIDEKVDIWGLGCTLYCMAFGRSPFETPEEGVLRLGILNAKYSYPKNFIMKDCQFSRLFIDLVDSMLSLDPRDRPSAYQVVETCESLLVILE